MSKYTLRCTLKCKEPGCQCVQYVAYIVYIVCVVYVVHTVRCVSWLIMTLRLSSHYFTTKSRLAPSVCRLTRRQPLLSAHTVTAPHERVKQPVDVRRSHNGATARGDGGRAFLLIGQRT